MTRSNVRVRNASRDDVPALVALLRALDPAAGPFSAKPLANSSPEFLGERLEELVDNADRILLVAADEAGALTGLLAARRDDVGGLDLTPVLHVTQLMVAQSHRRRGVGRALLTGAVQLADELGVEHLLASAAAGSREGNRYLARIGFAPLVVHRIAPIGVLRRSLGMTDVAGRVAVLRRARLVRAQRSGFAARAAGRRA